ncbi:MAG: HEAT repeat domain-containing protein [Candidatus Riflebacteria bacterium]|nr:HEAT repeat domain-containing protein [Candidatus Riflebacteria bacterium]
MEDLENLILELQGPIKTFRIFAIEKAIKSGSSARLLEELIRIRKFETDPECSMLLEHAVSSVKDRLHKGDNAAASRVTLADFARLSFNDQLSIIKKTKTAQFRRDASADNIKKLLAMSTHDVVKAEIVKKCCSFWPADYIVYLEDNLFSESSTLQLACIEAVILMAPDLFRKHFEKLVTSRDPLIRAVAIRGLAKKHPHSAATFLADSMRRGDYYSRLAALRAISVMHFAPHRASLMELLSHEQDERLLKIAAAIVLANPDREVPFRICDIVVKSNDRKKTDFLLALQKNCCSMIRMAELCPDFQLFLQTLKVYKQRAQALLFVENCISVYESSQDETRNELLQLLREKCQTPEVMAAIKSALAKEPQNELLRQALAPAVSALTSAKPVAVKSETLETQIDDANKLLKKLVRIRSENDQNAHEIICDAMSDKKSDSAITAAALRAAVAIGDKRWGNRAMSLLRRDSEDLQAAALEYLAVHDNESFMLQVRIFVKSPSLIVRTALLRSLCCQHPDEARELFQSMLVDKDKKVREKAVGSLIHFEFSSIREMLTAYLEREKDETLLRAGVAFYLANPMVESVYDLRLLEQNRPEHREIFSGVASDLIGSLSELGVAAETEVHDFVSQRQRDEKVRVDSEEERIETQRIESLTRKIDWKSVQESLSELSPLYPLLKKAFFVVMLFLGILFFLAGSGDETQIAAPEGFVPVVAVIGDYKLIVQQTDLADGAILATDANREKYLVLPRPGKAFRLKPGDQLMIRALPFRRDSDGVLIVKTLEIKNAP